MYFYVLVALEIHTRNCLIGGTSSQCLILNSEDKTAESNFLDKVGSVFFMLCHLSHYKIYCCIYFS
jgi:hypothetical protein